MKYLAMLFVLFNIAAAQNSPSNQAETSGMCSPVVQANQGKVQITCKTAMDEATKKKVVVLLNQILNNTKDTSATNKKLDDILEYVSHLQATNSTVSAPNGIAIGGNNTGIATVNNNPPVNPNAMTVTYDCGGNRGSTGPTPNTGSSVTLEGGKSESALQKMSQLNNAQQYSELLDTCRENIANDPEWLTPYLFCGLGYLASGDNLKAKEMLVHYEQYKGPAYNVEMCNNIEKFLRNNLQGF